MEGISVGRGGGCVFGGGVLLWGRGVREREFAVDEGNFGEGL